MKEPHFEQVMHLIDDEFLEEAAAPVRKKPALGILAAAACLCLILGAAWGIFASQPTDAFVLKLPENAQWVSQQLRQDDPAMPVLETTFTVADQQYVCRLASAAEPVDLSGGALPAISSMSWNTAQASFVYQQSDADASISWYAPETERQWYLTGGDPIALLTTAEAMVQQLGYSMAVAPEEAEDIAYRALLADGLLIGETSFSVDGVRCTYRMAATSALSDDFSDISGLSLSGEERETQVLWCPARITVAEDGQGKLVWFDIVPGLLYSLTMDHVASEESLSTMAAELFRPAQEPGQ